MRLPLLWIADNSPHVNATGDKRWTARMEEGEERSGRAGAIRDCIIIACNTCTVNKRLMMWFSNSY